MTVSVLFHVQHLLGIGHLQRSLRIADALARRDVEVTLVSGGPPVALPRHPAIRFVQLPPIRALDARFELIDGGGRPLDDALRAARRTAVLGAFHDACPDAVILEGFPFARRAFRFELDPLISAVRASRPRPLLLCSLRDIVVMRDDPARHRAVVERVRDEFDAVLVHGDPAFIPLDASFPLTQQIATRLIYTGYVAPPLVSGSAGSASRSGGVVVSAGGGAAGLALLQAALAARRLGCLPDARWRLLTGTNLPGTDFAALCAAAPAGVVVERFHANFTDLLRTCRVSVSQAGYNTVLDIIAARARAVLVPFAAERETEQSLRAERLAELGAAELVRAKGLSAGALAKAIERAAARLQLSLSVDAGGAARSADIIAAMIHGDAAAARDVVTGGSEGIIRR